MRADDSLQAAGDDGAAIEGKRKRRRGAKGRENLKTGPNSGSSSSGMAATSRATTSTSSNAISAKIDENNDDNVIKETFSSKKKRKKTSNHAPKPGEEGYLSLTQLRNARKRRAKKKKQQNPTVTNNHDPSDDDDDNHRGQNENKCLKKQTLATSTKQNSSDPSAKYLHDPLACPLVNRAKAYFIDQNVSFQVYVGKKRGWRTVSKLPTRGTGGGNDKQKVHIGLFEPNSHKIIAANASVAHHPTINATILKLQKLCNQLNIAPFDEKDGKGYLRYVCMNVDRSTKNVQLTLVWNSSPYAEMDVNEGKKQLNLMIDALQTNTETFKIHSLWVHFNAKWKHSDSVFDFGTSTTCQKLWKRIFGPQHIIEKLELPGLSDPVSLHFQPNVFRQANLTAFTKIIAAIRKYVVEYSKRVEHLPSCLELYGGVGTIGLSLHDVTSSLLSSDENPFNKDCFMKSVGLLPTTAQQQISYLSKSATEVVKDQALFKENNAEIVIVDPPRKGFDEAVLKSLTDEKINGIFSETKVLIYVSCGFAAFERDCNALLNSNNWTLAHSEGHVLFPGSDAIETLAFFISK